MMMPTITPTSAPTGKTGPATKAGQAPVSVIIPCFRCAATVGDAVASVAAQTLRPAEVLLVDDCSADGTLEALHRIAAHYPSGWVKVVSTPANGGPSRARNIGWEQASHEYIAFLDADDTWAPEKLAVQMAVLRDHPCMALIAHLMDVRERGSRPPTLEPPVRVRIIGRFRLLLNNPFPTASVVLRRDLPFRFDERFRRVEDFLLWAQIALSGHPCARVNQTLAFWHKANYGAGGLSGDLAAMHRAGGEVRRELLRLGLVTRSEHYFACGVGVANRIRRNLMLLLRTLRVRTRLKE